MDQTVQGIPASPGIVFGSVYVARWPILQVPHATVSSGRVDAEVERFRAACEAARRRTRKLRDTVERRLGAVQAKIFDPQLLMLEDPELIDDTVTYIAESYLTAERAFSLRVLEFRSQWLDATHARVLDRIADLNDIQSRVLSELVELDVSDDRLSEQNAPVVLVTKDIAPSRMVELDRDRIVGVAIDAGTRTAHASILARSLGIPAVVGLSDLSRRVRTGQEIILDGHRGQVMIDPSESQLSWYRDRDAKIREMKQDLASLVDLEPVTRDGTHIDLQVSLELPVDAKMAAATNAHGVGLFRTEFLVIGQSSVPKEEEQFDAFRSVVEIFAPRPVTIRTYDLGGDKFPLFLPALAGENPFLGWRGIRLYEKLPELFHNQVRAILRAAVYGPVKLLLPLVNSLEEVLSVKGVIARAAAELKDEGVDQGSCELGVMLETPAAIAIADILGPHVDFFSLGTNDLAQYALAVDRGNAQLSRFFDPYHPALLRLIRDAVEAARRQGRALSVCGESTSDALGVLVMIALGIRSLSCSLDSILEQKQLIRSIEIGRLDRLAGELLELETGHEIRRRASEVLSAIVDVSSLGTATSLSRTD